MGPTEIDWRLLVVDDTPANRELLLRRLEHAGFKVSLAAGGFEALEILDRDPVDLVLLDVMMPDLSGMDVLHWIRKRFSRGQLPVIMVTARDEPADIIAALEAGASDYVTKPINFPVVRARIDVQLAQLAALRDAAEQRRQRDDLEERMRQGQKMEAIGRLAGGIAHDFNNMLAVIIGYCGMLVNGLKEDPTHLAFVHEVKAAAERSAALTSQLLAFGRRQLLVRRPVDLNALLENLHNLLSRILGSHIALEIQRPEHTVVIEADPTQLEQVILNLALNARDAMPKSGQLLITLTTYDRYACFTVTDTGHGMDAATRLHCFEPFFTTKAIGEGTGLGLSVVEGIVAQSGGFIAVESEPEKGCTFRVHFPMSSGPPQG